MDDPLAESGTKWSYWQHIWIVGQYSWICRHY